MSNNSSIPANWETIIDDDEQFQLESEDGELVVAIKHGGEWSATFQGYGLLGDRYRDNLGYFNSREDALEACKRKARERSGGLI